MKLGLLIMLDKSAVQGLHNAEIDSLDRYFFQVVPPILVDEIRAGLSKTDDPKTAGRVAGMSYRVSGNHGLTLNAQIRLENSLIGNEVAMDSKFVPSGETIVETIRGSLATVIETPLEDEVLARWKRRDFTEEELLKAEAFRRRTERPLDPQFYLSNIQSAGLTFEPPTSDEHLYATVDALLADRRMLPRFSPILVRDFGISGSGTRTIFNRWVAEGRPAFHDFAPFAFYCLRANFLWNLSLTNPQLFKPDRNDRKDLQYAYYLPSTQIFVTKDDKQLRLMRGLVRKDQTLVHSDDLKSDLRRISEEWSRLSLDERIIRNATRGNAPPENLQSIVYNLWKHYDGVIAVSMHDQLIGRKIVDVSLPLASRSEMTLQEFLKQKMDEVQNGRPLGRHEIDELRRRSGSNDPTSMRLFNSTVATDRLLQWHPEMTIEEIESSTINRMWLDPSEYKDMVFL